MYILVLQASQSLVQRPKYLIRHQLLVIECKKCAFREFKGKKRIGMRTKYVTEAIFHLSLQCLVLHFPWVPGCQHLDFLHHLSKAIRFISYLQLILTSHVHNALGMGQRKRENQGECENMPWLKCKLIQLDIVRK